RAAPPRPALFPYATLFRSLEDERFNHQRHPVAVALRFQAQDILDALVGDLGLLGDLEEIDDDAGGVEAQRLHHRFLDDPREQGPDRKSTRLNSSHVKISYA